MTTYQRMIVQCPRCQKWFILRDLAGKWVGVQLEDLVASEDLLFNECLTTHHKGRRRWQHATTTK